MFEVAVGQYLVPLLVLELFFWARDYDKAGSSIAVATVIVLLTLFMATGVFAAGNGMWLPRIQ